MTDVASIAIPGRTSVAARALRRTFAALAAEELGVSESDVQARVVDAGGRVSVRIEGPVTLGRLAGDRAPGDGVLARADAARDRVQGDGHALTGAAIGDVHVRVSGARLAERRRLS